MQPHSISALAVTRHVFAFGNKLPKGGEVAIKYKRWTGTDWEGKKLYQTIKSVKPIIREGEIYWRGLLVEVKASDQLTCELKIMRSSTGEFKKGSEKLEVTHSVQHRSGLREEYTLDRSAIKGEHFNSERYGNFKGTGGHEGFFKLTCQVRKLSFLKDEDRRRAPFAEVDYTVMFSPNY